ncbi:hypothetical protein [Chryseobacterium camelliae]|uniref:hypothetical protein n=1 Tax=Chryseobacterium camelliae TaxID=1265445 RepID=UPI002861F70A|nr:hypothetical protein [Chryseobacterium camelliae]MDR6515648.1 hypothetical protein [Chryseobacterium camelliae]
MTNNKSNQSLEENLNSIDYSYIDFINSQTQTLGNYLIWISTLIILLSSNIISISEIEFNGLRIDLNKEYISYILFIINFYYFLRFYYLLSFDNLNFKIPKQVDLIINEAKDKIKYYSSSIEEYKNDFIKISQEVAIVHSEEKDENVRDTKLEILKIQTKNLQNQIDDCLNSINYFSDLLEKTEIKLVKGNKYLKNNNLINNYFPKIMFFSSLITVLINLFKYLF